MINKLLFLSRAAKYQITSLTREPMQRAVSGVCSAGLSMTTLPQARAGASFRPAM